MKILHLCLGSFFPDNYSYQENMLPKFHKQFGYDVEVIASLATFDKNGNPTYLNEVRTYLNEYGIRVVRLDYKKPVKLFHKLKRYIGLYPALVKSKPDIMFIHGCQFRDMDVVVEYLKTYPNVRVYVDNHADTTNSGKNFLSKYILHKLLWKYSSQMINPYTIKFYGVLPARVDWLINMYDLPKEKCELLVMGADDDKVKEILRPEVRKSVREQYGIHEGDILIMTGGKIDGNKRETLTMMEAVSSLSSDYPNVKLIVFGSVTEKLQQRFEELIRAENITYIGWLKGDDIYEYFSAADIVAFPGLHSVLWEQAIGSGKACIFRKMEGFQHINLGGNCAYFENLSVEGIRKTIQTVLDTKSYLNMEQIAIEKGIPYFSYKDIAKRCIEE